MVCSNIHSLDEASDDTSSPPLPNHPTTGNIDDHNNPIIMTEPTEPTPTSTTDEPPPPTSEVPFPDNNSTATSDDDTTSFDSQSYDPNHSVFLSPALSSCGEDSDASDTTCENDTTSAIECDRTNNTATITTHPPSIKSEDATPPDSAAKSFGRADDFHISHSTPVVVSQMATAPLRPMKSIRPNNKVVLSNPAPPKSVHFGGEDTKPTVRVLLLCQPTSHPFQTRNIVLEPNQEVKVGRSITRNRVAENNAIFDCKVLSRNHALIWMADGKFYIRDTASSNGTYVNDHRLSLTATPSKPYEVKTGDVVQFGVDVLENSYKEKHGCIVTMLKFCTGSSDTEELKRAVAADDVRGSGKAGSLARSLSSAELYRLNTFIQEAVQREQILETKLLSLQKIIDLSRKNSANVWHSMIEEDRLLSRIDILENKLQYFQKNFTDDKLRKEIIKLQDDKSVYQNSAKEALRKVYQDRNEAVMKLATIERALCSCEDECALLRNQLIKSQTNFKEVTGTLTMLEERDAKLQQQEQVYIQREALTDQKILDLYEQIKLKTVECMNTKTALDATLKQKNDMLERIEMYEKIGDRISEPEEEEEEEDGTGDPAQPTTLMRWLGKMGETGEVVEAVLIQRNKKKAIKKESNESLAVKLSNIEKNLAALDQIHSTVNDDLPASVPIKTEPTESDSNNSDILTIAAEDSNHIEVKSEPEPTAQPDDDQKQVVRDTIEQLKDMYAEIRKSLMHMDTLQKDRANELESQLVESKEEIQYLHGELRARPHQDDHAAKLKECEELRRQVIELATTAQYMQLQLEKPSLVPSPKRADTHVQTDDLPPPEVAPVAVASSTVFVQTEPSPPAPDPVVPEIAHTTDVKPPNGFHAHETTCDMPTHHIAVQKIADAVSPFTEEYADDIALLVDPNVRREEELIAFKEQNDALTESNRQLVHQLKLVNSQTASSTVQPPLVWIVAVLFVIIGYLLVSPYL